MKKLNVLKYIPMIAMLFPFGICHAQTDDELAKTIADDTTNKYAKHIFYVESVSYESGNYNGTDILTSYILHGKGTCTIPGEKPAERVNINFVSDPQSLKPYYDTTARIIYIYYPKNQFDYIQNLLLNSDKIWAQFFYCGENNIRTYGDVHGRLHLCLRP